MFTGYIGAYPCLTKTAFETRENLEHFKGRQVIEYMYSDGAYEIDLACRNLWIPHDTSEAGEPQGNGIAERQVQEVKQATIANLAQAGLPHRYWHMAMKHAQTGLNIAKPGWGCSSAWEERHRAPFYGLHVPFGALVKFIPNKTSNMWGDIRPL